jgi:hypothetical protein
VASIRPQVRRVGGSRGPSAATLADDPTGAEVGKTGSRQGSEFRQGFSTRSSGDFGANSAFGLGAGLDFREPQQQEAPRHFEPHLQASACEAASNEFAFVSAAAWISPENANTITTASRNRPPRGSRGGWRGSARTGRSRPSLGFGHTGDLSRFE